MKVIQIKLRTPGIFLGRPDFEQGIQTPELTLKLQVGSEWKTLEEIPDIKVIADHSLPSSSVEGYVTQAQLETASVKVPLQGEGEKHYNLLVPDNREWNFRVEATPCVECVNIFRSYGRDEDILDGLSVVVAKGKIKS